MGENILFFVLSLIIISFVLCIPSQNNDPISIQKCREYLELEHKKKHSAIGNIAGGEPAKLGEFPHMAAIAWRERNGKMSIKCGGSLISDRFILTTAHCTQDRRKKPSTVRLGDLDLASDDDGCTPVDLKIKNIIKHEHYSTDPLKNDIALIELKESVNFTENIRPACLHQDEQYYGNVIITGWGQNETDGETVDKLQKSFLTVISKKDCEKLYEDEDDDKSKQISPNQFCAQSNSTTNDQDSCQGDGGGPAQIPYNHNFEIYQIVGLISAGKFQCGSGTPGIYTRVSSYIDWIESKVWK